MPRLRPGSNPGALLVLVAALGCSGALTATTTDPPGAHGPPAGGYAWSLPPGFPPPAVPADNPMSSAKVELGCRLFFEPRLSRDGTIACATCHQPERAFTDGRPTSPGLNGVPGRRSAMTLANVAYNASYTWASAQLVTLEEQMHRPLFGHAPLEMGLVPTDGAVQAALTDDYTEGFRAAFPDAGHPVSIPNLTRAIAAFERSLVSGRSPFDRYVFDDDRDALTGAARRGMALFYSDAAGCGDCHSGINFAGTFVTAATNAPPLFANTGLYDLDGRGAYPAADTGLLEETGLATDMGRFRVPTLRNVGLTAPYMHDGSVATLKEVVTHYANGGRHSAPPTGSTLRDPRIRRLNLGASERADLVAFLEALTDRDFVARNWRDCSSAASN
jgi:cytochrome c peroxidase